MEPMKTRTLRGMVTSAAMAALGLTLPMAFHAVGLGSKFAPMLLPLMLNGFLSPIPWAVLTGAVVPLFPRCSRACRRFIRLFAWSCPWK